MILLIAYGNVLRRDDAAGIVLARRVGRQCRRADLEIIECQQLTPELAPRLADPAVTAVIFTDAATDPSAPLLRHLAETADLPPFGHHLGPASLLDLATRLYGRRPPAWLATVPAEDFRFGIGLARRTRQELRRAEREILAMDLFPNQQ
jgi:hydrogenase maturation protease